MESFPTSRISWKRGEDSFGTAGEKRTFWDHSDVKAEQPLTVWMDSHS